MSLASFLAGWDRTGKVGLVDHARSEPALVRANTPAYRGDRWARFLGTERPIALVWGAATENGESSIRDSRLLSSFGEPWVMFLHKTPE